MFSSPLSQNTVHAAPLSEKAQDDTRQRLILAAASVFGSQGFEGASTRRIAALAGTNISSIAYHFGGKENLYLAVADYIAQEIGKKVDEAEALLADERERVKDGTLPPAAAIALLQRLWSEWLDKFLVNEKYDDDCDWAWFVIREEANPTEAFDRIYNASIVRFLNLLAELIGCIQRRPAQSLKVRLQAVLLFGTMLSFKRERATVARYLGWKTLDETAQNTVRAAINEEVAHLLILSEETLSHCLIEAADSKIHGDSYL
ncbi:MAG: CerR family C-terminal domain-containing protein [Burkholderiales bacterium]|jgi:AcrR family transcriptional regulator|nr:CerR family C-terminal domain-containing protein [Burkholderiales bacterium]